MAAPERATWHDDVSKTSPGGRSTDVSSGPLLTSALTKSTLTVDWSTGSVGSAGQWAPQVSLSLETYKWDPRVRVNQKKKKKKERV